ncbi:MAG: sigma-70 family RNA polymerase sigma factor [Rubricoccaceae bacterium]|nr:sigma-70 family RNA polymerase sigma factor [Rubricoccaceae bacterium]
MPSTNRLDRLGTLARRLPFPLEDFDAVNRTFCRWAARREDADLELLEVWLYCYVQRFVVVRLLHLGPLGAGETDRIIGQIYDRAREFDKVAEPERFTHWLSVVCKNTYLNALRRRYQPAALDEDALLDNPVDAEPGLYEMDRAHLRHALAEAFRALPQSLRDVARMRLLEQRPYDEIAEATGHPLPTVRTYAAKAVRRLREDPNLRATGEALGLLPAE